MKYPLIIDSCILINLKNNGYSFSNDSDREFWEYLYLLAQQNYIKIPESVIQELEMGNDELAEWVQTNKDILKLDTKPLLYSEDYIKVIDAYDKQIPNGLSETDVEWIGGRADPYIVAHALHEDGTVVTAEVKKGPAVTIQNIKIPTICASLNVPYITLAKFVWHIAQKKLSDIE